MAVLSITSNANLNLSTPLAYERAVWSSRPVKFVITTTPGESIVSIVLIAGLPVDFNFVEDIPGSGIWTSFADTIFNGTNFGAGTTTICHNITATTGPAFPFCFNVQCAAAPLQSVVITLNNIPQPGTTTVSTGVFGIGQANGTSIISVTAGDVLRLENNYFEIINLAGTGAASLTIQKVD